MKPVLSKRDFVRRYHANEFGNRCPSWETLDAFAQSDYRGLVHLRNRVAAGVTHYNLSPKTATRMWRVKTIPTDWYCSAMGPGDNLRRLQGEVTQLPSIENPRGAHLLLLYTTIKLPMRSALTRWSREVTGVEAEIILDWGMSPRSREWLEYLLEKYPNHVVEFTAWEIEWGTLPGYDTTFWEVRSY